MLLTCHLLSCRITSWMMQKPLFEVSQIIRCFLLKVLLLFPYPYLRLRTIASFSLQVILLLLQRALRLIILLITISLLSLSAVKSVRRLLR